MDSGVLFGSKEMIEQRVRETAKAAKDMGVRHVMNLGHGIMQVSDLGRNRQMFSWLLEHIRFSSDIEGGSPLLFQRMSQA